MNSYHDTVILTYTTHKNTAEPGMEMQYIIFKEILKAPAMENY